MLLERRCELLNEIHPRVRDIREVGSDSQHHTTDLPDAVEAEPEDDLLLALVQMKADTLERVDDAIRHFDEGTYGFCVDCGDVIAPSRLRAMPFAVRCRDCEETREDEQHRVGVRLRRELPGPDSRYWKAGLQTLAEMVRQERRPLR